MNTEALKTKLNEKVNERKITMQETTITKADNSYAALSNNTLDIIRENLKNQPLSFQLFDIIKSPSGGTTAFTVPGLAGEEMEKSITGIILDYTTPRAYWDTPDPVEGTPPVCFSSDSLVSSDGKACSQCVYNTFGSKNGESNAKACKESVLLFMLRPDNIMPVLVRIPVFIVIKIVKSAYLFLRGTIIGLSDIFHTENNKIAGFPVAPIAPWTVFCLLII